MGVCIHTLEKSGGAPERVPAFAYSCIVQGALLLILSLAHRTVGFAFEPCWFAFGTILTGACLYIVLDYCDAVAIAAFVIGGAILAIDAAARIAGISLEWPVISAGMILAGGVFLIVEARSAKKGLDHGA